MVREKDLISLKYPEILRNHLIRTSKPILNLLRNLMTHLIEVAHCFKTIYKSPHPVFHQVKIIRRELKIWIQNTIIHQRNQEGKEEQMPL